MDRNSDERKKMEKRLRMDALVIQQRSIMLKEKSIALCDEIETFADKYPDDLLNELPWDEKERVMAKADELRNRWAANRRWLKILDAEFRELCKRTNEFYGKNTVQTPEPLNVPETLEDEYKDEPTEEWSKSENWWKDN